MDQNIKNYRANDFWDRLLEKDFSTLFTTSLSTINKKSVFKEYAEVINLELSTQCNRHCGYCPLSNDSRGELQNIMHQSLLDKVINELKEVDYDGVISLNLYNEPLLDSELENSISYIKTNLPNSFISFNSNGDYLTKDRLCTLKESGLDEIRVTLHTENYQDRNRKKAIDIFFKKLNSDYEINKFVSNEMIMVEKRFNNLNLITMCTNWNKIGNDRTGTVELDNQKIIRNKPCMKPFREIVISAEGNCYPCCNFFPNSTISQKFLIGNISEKTIFDIFASEIMVNCRKNLLDFSPKFSPCNTCSDIDNSTLNSDVRRKYILKNISIEK